MAKKATPQPTQSIPAPSRPSNRATVVDYDQSFLGPTIKKLKVGQQVSLVVKGEVTRLEERYSKGGGKYQDPYDSRCEIEIEPKSATVRGGGNMVGEVNAEKKKRGGGYYADDEGDD